MEVVGDYDCVKRGGVGLCIWGSRNATVKR